MSETAQPQFIREVGRSWENQGDDASYSVDLAGEIDSLDDWMREEWLVSVRQASLIISWHSSRVEKEAALVKAEQLGRIVGMLIQPDINLRVAVRALALALGLDQLQGVDSQAEVARELGVTRALVNYWVMIWVDLLKVDITKYRKTPASREKFSEGTKAAWARRHGITFPKPQPNKYQP